MCDSRFGQRTGKACMGVWHEESTSSINPSNLADRLASRGWRSNRQVPKTVQREHCYVGKISPSFSRVKKRNSLLAGASRSSFVVYVALPTGSSLLTYLSLLIATRLSLNVPSGESSPSAPFPQNRKGDKSVTEPTHIMLKKRTDLPQATYE